MIKMFRGKSYYYCRECGSKKNVGVIYSVDETYGTTSLDLCEDCLKKLQGLIEGFLGGKEFHLFGKHFVQTNWCGKNKEETALTPKHVEQCIKLLNRR